MGSLRVEKLGRFVGGPDVGVASRSMGTKSSLAEATSKVWNNISESKKNRSNTPTSINQCRRIGFSRLFTDMASFWVWASAGAAGRALTGGSILTTAKGLGAGPDGSLIRANFSGFIGLRQEAPQKTSRTKQAAKVVVLMSGLDIVHTIICKAGSI